EGEPLPGHEEEDSFIDSLPLVEVARSWNLTVATFNAEGGNRGHARVLLGKDAQRLQAEREVPALRGALRSHVEAEKRFTRQQGAASKVSIDVPEIRALLQRVTSTLRQVEALSRGSRAGRSSSPSATSGIRPAVPSRPSCLPRRGRRCASRFGRSN